MKRMTVNDHDWIKILVSAVVGMFTGLIADPVRASIQNRIELRRLKSAIIWDFTTLATNASRLLEGNMEAPAFWHTVELPGFDYYWEKNRELFYANSKLVLLRLQCQIINRLCGLVEHKMRTPDEAMEKVYETIAQVKLIHDMSWRERRRLARSMKTSEAKHRDDNPTGA
jgi:hypothetical protein